MSEFDKEAEREKLRKQFAEDEKDREETERMSELLLGGATMTNKHCERCGNPLFRQDGHTFCSNCGDDFRAAAGGDGTATEPAIDDGGAEVQSTPETASSSPQQGQGARDAAGQPPSNPSVSTPTIAEGGDLSAARESLVRTLTTFARRAEAAENPGHARELLSTAREAAETLAALDRIGQNR